MTTKTDRGYDDPTVTQLSVFLQNRVGELRDVLRRLEAAQVQVHALSVADSVDYAIVRIIVDHVDTARSTLRGAGFAVSENLVLAVGMPPQRDGLLAICQALIGAEINIHYAYPMLTRPKGCSVVIVNVDSRAVASDVLKKAGFDLVDEPDLAPPIFGVNG